jgi:hypothetical protein
MGYPLVISRFAMEAMALIEIDGVYRITVLKNGGSFHGYVKQPDNILITRR